MKLVMLTSSYDRSLKEEGFIADWIDALAKETSELVIILLKEPSITPNIKNTTVHSLHQPTKIGKLKEIWQILNEENKKKQINGIFSHIFEFLAVVGGLWGKLNGVETAYWYAGGVNLHLISLNTLAFHLNNKILTCSDSEADRYAAASKINKNKIVVMGHAINTQYFIPATKKVINNIFTIGYVCRCTPQKNIESLIYACQKIDRPIHLKLALSRTKENEKYFQFLKTEIERVKKQNKQFSAEILTNINYDNLPAFYHSLNLYIHPSLMKSVDKAGLEAMAAGVPVLLSKVGYGEMFAQYPNQLIDPNNIAEISQKISDSIQTPTVPIDISKFSLQNFMKKVTMICQ